MPHDHPLDQDGRAVATPLAGELWRHFRGGLYRVVCVATDEATGRAMVVYHPAGRDDQGRPVWTRSLYSWMQVVTPAEGVTVCRFVRVDPEDMPIPERGATQDATDDVPTPGPSPRPPDDVYA